MVFVAFHDCGLIHTPSISISQVKQPRGLAHRTEMGLRKGFVGVQSVFTRPMIPVNHSRLEPECGRRRANAHVGSYEMI